MLFGDHIFFYCGPPVFGAAEILKIDLYEQTDIYTKIGINFLKRYDPQKTGNLELCRFCWANSNFEKEKYSNDPMGGKW
jgi:hypothetical protein